MESDSPAFTREFAEVLSGMVGNAPYGSCNPIAHLLRNCTGDSSDKVVCRDFHCLLYRDVSI
jgi:hypothetical protein